MAAPAVIVRKKHDCSAEGCTQPIFPKQPAVVIHVKTMTAAGEGWETKYFHPKCQEAKVGEIIVLPTYQPYLFY